MPKHGKGPEARTYMVYPEAASGFQFWIRGEEGRARVYIFELLKGFCRQQWKEKEEEEALAWQGQVRRTYSRITAFSEQDQSS